PDRVALISAWLGIFFTITVIASGWLVVYHKYWQLPAFMAILCLFHFLEYWITARYNPSKVSIDSFLFNNGSQYSLAHGAALTEAIIEWIFFKPVKKNYSFVSILGLGLIIWGQCLRSMAMIHASKNFSHIIAHHKADSHDLVKTGVYSITRHPSYLGYFWWAIGTQLFILNPVSTVGFSVVLWRFFNRRIKYEENLLIKFFGEEYVEYKKTTPTLIPFI
ncbi:Isoprenylcysteine carboxyl methyltransferase family-domain-containing protein, partial [Lipomyces japonicus]|uniref:Isoprenylcysteine carboxyl methyltransferase family-domain-containing protein n=1 Tax=Lipomyces japonicus TaxID=56871 RepID=UPI0034CFAF13